MCLMRHGDDEIYGDVGTGFCPSLGEILMTMMLVWLICYYFPLLLSSVSFVVCKVFVVYIDFVIDQIFVVYGL
jgi:hypothetical protein